MLTTWHCPHSPAAPRAAERRAAERPAAAVINRYLLLAGPTAANPQQQTSAGE